MRTLLPVEKSIISLIIILCISASLNAQYRINKTKYNYKTYTYQAADPYDPALAGLASFFIPGLGQIILGETGRGAGFMGGFAGSIIMVVSGVKLSQSYTESNPGNEGSLALVTGLVLVGSLGIIVVDIWAITDAIRVAKVNNLTFRDKNKTGFNVKVTPYIGLYNSKAVPVGLSLKIQF
jgi:hypothetical protein